jgi:hypothetical protein
MSTSDSHRAPEIADLARMLPVPAERDLAVGRRHALKEHLMTEFRANYAAPARARTRRSLRPTFALAAAAGALATAVAVVTVTVLSGQPAHPPRPAQPATLLLSKIADAAAKGSAPHVRDRQFEYVASRVAFSVTSVVAGQPGSITTLEKPHKRQVWYSVSNLCIPGLLKESGHVEVLNDPPSDCPDHGSLNDPTYRFLQSLPTNPHALLRLIFATEKGHGQTPDQEAFTTIGDLLGESVAPPAVSAALYRAAALIPGVTVVTGAKDAIGRRGVAVAFAFRGTRTEWIFDSKTLRWLGEREVSIATGKVTGETAILARAIVDHAGQLPKRVSAARQ